MHQSTIQMTIRVPFKTVERVDALAEQAGLTRAQMLRLLVSRASQESLPVGLTESADCLREARGVAL